MNIPNGVMLAVTLACIGVFISSLIVLRDIAVKNAVLRSRAERQSKRQETRDGETVLVEVAIPLECIGAVRCDFDGIHHVQVLGEEVDTDEETYRRVVEARDAHLRRARELGGVDMSIKYYHLAKDEEPPEEFCAVRDVNGEPDEYTFYVPEAENAKLRELCKAWRKFSYELFDEFIGDPEMDDDFMELDDRLRELGVGL